jgi:hypothetical protein
LTGVIAISREAPRKWADKNDALTELREEGRRVTGPYPGRLPIKQEPRQRFHGYGLIRTVH